MPSICSEYPASPVTSKWLLQSGHGLDGTAVESVQQVISVSPDAGAPQQQRQLVAQVAALVTAARQRDASMAILSHELASPLASIQNAVAIMRLGTNDAALQLNMHALIERQLQQIAILTKSLRDVPVSTLAEFEQFKLQRERIDLYTVLTRAAETVEPAFAQRAHKLALHCTESHIWVFADAGRLEQVFANLLTNASKYTQVGGEIVMAIGVNGGDVLVQVRDSGIGIALEAIPHIFNLFARADTEAVRARPGRGIGLALARSILKMHGGSITAASAGLGLGSEFTVRLKLDASALLLPT